MAATTESRSSVVSPEDHAKVYGGVAPLTVRFAEPLVPPKQKGLTTEVPVLNADGCPIVIVSEELQELKSLIKT